MMRLTRQAEIAVQVLALCERSGAGPGSGRAITTRQAAGFAGTTKDHAAQVVARLVRDGWLESVRGRGGGLLNFQTQMPTFEEIYPQQCQGKVDRLLS